MFALDLFNNDHERRLAEGAVDKLEQRRIDDLAMKMDDLVARAKKADTPAAKQALMKEFQKCKAERDGYFKIKDECMGYGTLVGEQGLPDVADKQAKMARLNQPGRSGTDAVTPQQRVAGATMPSNTALGKAKETFSSFANWLAGRDDTGPTYEASVSEQTAPISPVNSAKYAYEQMRKAHDDNVDIATIRWMGNQEPITMSRNQLYHTLTKLKGMSRQNRNQFALQTLANRNNFALWLGGQKKVASRPQLKQQADPFQPELPLGKPTVAERAQKKNSDNENYGDAEVARSVQKIRAKYPAARSDIEALAKDEIEHTKRSDQQLAAIKGANTEQDALLRQLVALDKKQGEEIDHLDSENNSQEQELNRIQATNSSLQKTIQAMTGTKQSARAKKQPTAEPKVKAQEPSAVPPAAEVDPEIIKKVQGLETQIQSLQSQPQSPEIVDKIDKLQNQINSLPAKAAQALNIEPDVSTKPAKQSPRVQAPFGDLDIAPTAPKSKVSKPEFTPKPAKTKAKVTEPSPTDDEFDLLNIDESTDRLHQGDPIVVTAPNEFEGATGEIYEFSPSGSFVIVNLYNHGKHSMHLSDVEYNKYADDEDEIDESTMSELDAMRQDLERMNDRQFFTAYGISKAAFQQKYRTLLNPAQQQDTPVEEVNEASVGEGYQDFNKVEPYAVCLAGKPVKQFDYYEDARRFHDNWKKKLYAQGDKAKADKITLMPIMDEAVSKGTPVPAKDFIKGVLKDLKKVNVKEAEGSWIVYDPETKQIKKRFKTHTAGKSYAKAHNLGFASSEYYFDNIKQPVNELDVNTLKSYADKRGAQVAGMKADNPNPQAGSKEWVQQAVPAQQVGLAKRKIARKERQQGVAETVTDVKSEMARVYRKLAPKIERYKDSFLAGQLYDELENIAELHGAEGEFKRMMAGARNRAHMDYDTNPGGFQNWFWYLPFEDQELSEESSTSSEEAESAILKRIMVAHLDLLKEFGPEKVMQAVEEVAYGVGDLDEIGSSDVSGWVHQVKEILGVPEELDEKWSAKYKRSIDCSHPKGFSQRAHCAGRKK